MAITLAVSLLGGMGAVPTGAQDGAVAITLSFTDAASAAVTAVAEDGGAQTVRVAATAASATASDVTVTVTAGAAGGTAVAGSCSGEGDSQTCTGDYRTGASSATVTIKAGTTRGVSDAIVVTPHSDDVTEDGETIRFTGVAAGYKVSAADLLLADADRGLVLTLSHPVMTERGDRAGETAENVCDCRPESVHRTTLTATLSGSSSTYGSDLRMLVAFQDGTATRGSVGDWHTEHGGKAPAVYVTIPAGSVSAAADRTLEFFSWVDDTAELDETFTVTVTAPDGDPVPGFAVTPAAMTIADDDAAIALTLNRTSVAEGFTGSLTVSASMPGASRSAIGSALSIPITAQGEAGDFGADAEEDYTFSDTTAVIPALSTSGSAVPLGLKIIDDTVVDAGDGEGNVERLTIGGTQPPGLSAAVAPAVLEITDDDARVILTADTAPEGGSGAAVNVSAAFPADVTASHLTADTVVTLDVKAETPGGAGSAGAADFSYSPAAPNTVTIPGGAVGSSVPGTLAGLAVKADGMVEGPETLLLEGSSRFAKATALVTAPDADDDIVLSVSPDAVAEGGSPREVTVTASFAGSSSLLKTPTEVTAAVAGGSGPGGAQMGANGDFTTDGDSFTVAIPAGATSGSGTFQLSAPADDNFAEGDEAVVLSGSAAVGGAAVGVTGAAITIRDSVPVNLSFTDGAAVPAAVTGVREGGGGQTVRIKAAVDAAPSSNLTVNVAVGAKGGSALSGNGKDYVSSASSAQVVIKVGETSGLSPALTITPTADGLVEGDETIRFTGTADDGYGVRAARLNLLDGDDDIALMVSPDAVVEGSSPNLITVTAAFSGATASALAADTQITVAVAGGSGPDGAQMGTDGDFTTDRTSFTVTVPGGLVSGTGIFRLTAPADGVAEGAEKADVSGVAAVAGRPVAVTGDQLQIIDAGIRLSVTDPADGSAVTAVSEQAGAARTVRVTAVLPSGTTAGPDGATVPFELASGSARLDSDGSAFGTGEDFQVVYAGADPAADDGFASGIAIPAGSSSHYMDVTLTVNDDETYEGSETILLRGGQVAIADASYPTAGGQLEIIDDDAAPTAIKLTLLTAADADLPGVAENGGTAKVRVRASFVGGNSLPWPVTVPLQVGVAGRAGFSAHYNPCSPPQHLQAVSLGGGGTLAITGDTALAGTDYAAVDGLSVVIPAFSASGFAEFDLVVADDALREGTESLTVDGDPAGTLSRFTVMDDSLLIYDDDLPLSAVDIALLDYANRPISQVTEGGYAGVTVRLSYPGGVVLDEERTVWVRVEEMTATYREDYSIYCVIQRALTIPAGQQRAEDSFGLITSGVPYNDNIVEGDETLRVTGQLAGYSFTPQVITIKDDDMRPSQIQLAVSPAAVDESAGEQSVTLTAQFPANSAVLLSDTAVSVTVGGDALSGFDFRDLSVESPFTVTIPAGSRQGQVKIKLEITDDEAYEGDERIAFTGSARGFAVAGAALTISDNDPLPVNAPDEAPTSNPPQDPPGEDPPAEPQPPVAEDPAPPEDPPAEDPPPPAAEDPAPLEGPPPPAVEDPPPPVHPQPPPSGDPAPPPASGSPAPPQDPPAEPRPPSSGNPAPPPPAPPPTAPAVSAEPSDCRGTFCDEDDSVHAANIEQIAQWGITAGCDPGNPTRFCPGERITRRQMAAFLYRAAIPFRGISVPQDVSIADVSADAWYRPFADWGVSLGAFAAPQGEFRPDGVVTRADMAVMMIAVFPHLAASDRPEGLFADADGLDPATIRAIEGMHAAGVTRGCSADPLRYCPDQPVTRAQMASFFVRAINYAPPEAG